MQDFRKLKVWEKAHHLTIDIYRATDSFPRREQFGLVAQLRRASSSIPANIAEGCGRGSQRQLAQFLQVALGSANELEYHLLLASDLSYMSRPAHSLLRDKLVEIRMMLVRLIRRVRSPGSAYQPS
jgi:four helix bundle protein